MVVEVKKKNKKKASISPVQKRPHIDIGSWTPADGELEKASGLSLVSGATVAWMITSYFSQVHNLWSFTATNIFLGAQEIQVDLKEHKVATSIY